jgi:hypothetical protein
VNRVFLRSVMDTDGMRTRSGGTNSAIGTGIAHEITSTCSAQQTGTETSKSLGLNQRELRVERLVATARTINSNFKKKSARAEVLSDSQRRGFKKQYVPEQATIRITCDQ